MSALMRPPLTGGRTCGAHVVSRHAMSHVLRIRRPLRCHAANSGPLLDLHFGETTVSVPFDANKAKELKASMEKLIATFAEKQNAERPKRWPSMEYRFKGQSPEEPVEYLEVFCNPNAHSSLLDARVLVTLRTSQGVRLLTEGRLTGMKSDVDSFLEQLAPQTAPL